MHRTSESLPRLRAIRAACAEQRLIADCDPSTKRLQVHLRPLSLPAVGLPMHLTSPPPCRGGVTTPCRPIQQVATHRQPARPARCPVVCASPGAQLQGLAGHRSTHKDQTCNPDAFFSLLAGSQWLLQLHNSTKTSHLAAVKALATCKALLLLRKCHLACMLEARFQGRLDQSVVHSVMQRRSFSQVWSVPAQELSLRKSCCNEPAVVTATITMSATATVAATPMVTARATAGPTT